MPYERDGPLPSVHPDARNVQAMPVNAWTMVATLAGGLGLFLLGMTMMTDGLKLAAGPALERVLTRATRTRWHALTSGALMTAVVQSSSAVTVAAIGFVNAGLMTLAPALWVLFGANVGTTMTGWIVALVGLKFKIEALALPLGPVELRAVATDLGGRIDPDPDRRRLKPRHFLGDDAETVGQGMQPHAQCPVLSRMMSRRSP